MFRNKWMQKVVAGAMVAAMTLSIGAMGAKAASTTTIDNNAPIPLTPIVTTGDTTPTDTLTNEEVVLGATRDVNADTVGSGNADGSSSNSVNAAGSGSNSTGSSVSAAPATAAVVLNAAAGGEVLGATRSAEGGMVLGAGRSPKTADGGNGMLILLAVASFAGAGALAYNGKNRA